MQAQTSMTSLRPHYPQARRQAEAARSHPATRGSRQCRPANACFKWYARAFRRSRSLAVRLLLNYGKVALICATIEAVGLGLIWLAPFSALSLSGAALTGIGYSLVYPGFGVEAVRNAPAQTRGLAMAAYTAFLDVALGFGTPVLGLLAAVATLGAAFVASAVAALCAAGIA